MSGLTLAETAEDTVRRIESLDIKCKASSRFGRSAKVLKTGFIGPDDPDHAVALESLRDVLVMHFVLCELMGKVPRDVLREKVRLAVKDESLPQDDADETPGRNAQCELHVAAVCSRAGMKPSFAEPDIRCCVKDAAYAIAAKRVKSARQLQRRCNHAAKQIEGSGMEGIIAVDASLAFIPGSSPLVSDANIEQRQLAHREAWKPHVCSLSRRKFEAVEWLAVLGLLIIHHEIRNVPHTNEWYLETFTAFRAFTQDEQRRKRQFEVFQCEYMKGLVNRQRG